MTGRVSHNGGKALCLPDPLLPPSPLEGEGWGEGKNCPPDTVSAYISHDLMPADPAGDALHLAIASVHKCDILLTWNCRHLANANKFAHIRRVNGMLGLFVPMLITPLELLGEIESP